MSVYTNLRTKWGQSFRYKIDSAPAAMTLQPSVIQPFYFTIPSRSQNAWLLECRQSTIHSVWALVWYTGKLDCFKFFNSKRGLSNYSFRVT